MPVEMANCPRQARGVMAEGDGTKPPAVTGLKALGRALRHRNYRLFFSGQSLSLIGTWLTRIVTSWLIYRLTGSALLLGILGFAGQLPTPSATCGRAPHITSRPPRGRARWPPSS
jgi:hypothetical protein